MARNELYEIFDQVNRLNDPSTIGKTFGAIDSGRAWPWSDE